jgi:hypothetical protein
MQKTNELDLGNITIVVTDDEKTREHFVEAFRLIADHDPQLFAQMRAKNWRIATCNELRGICDEMEIQQATGWSPSTPGKKFLGTDIDTFISMLPLAFEAIMSGTKFNKLLAAVLAHEFVHLFLGPGEVTPTECSLQLAEKMGDQKLIEYFKRQLKNIGPDNEWEE